MIKLKKLLVVQVMLGAFLLMGVTLGHAYQAYNIDGMLLDDWGIDLSAAGITGYLDANLPLGGRDIDVFTEDNADTVSGWQEVGPGWSLGNLFDAEAMYVDNDNENLYLAIVTGLSADGSYSPTPDDYGDYHFEPGDIGFDIDGLPGYEYALNIRDGNIYSSVEWLDPTVDAYVSEAGPWMMSSGDLVAGVDFVYSGNQNSHYVIEAMIPLSMLGLENAIYGVAPAIQKLNINWTMQCGNDFLNLDADVNAVPEPGTMLMLGIGLAGLAGINRKKLFKK